MESSPFIEEALSAVACNLNTAPVLTNRRLKLLQYLREVSSSDYNRYGNLGERENKKRHPFIDAIGDQPPLQCNLCGNHE